MTISTTMPFPVQRKGDGGRVGSEQGSHGTGGRHTPQLRELSFTQGESLLSPPPSGGGGNAPVQLKGDGDKMVKPGAKSRLSATSSYKKVYDLEKKARKAKPGKKLERLLRQLRERAEQYLKTHRSGRSKKQDARVESVERLLKRLRGDNARVEDRRDVPPPQDIPEPPREVRKEPEVVVEDTLPEEVTDENLPEVLEQLELPPVELGGEVKGESNAPNVEPTPEKKDEAPKIPEAPPLGQQQGPRFGQLPNGVSVEQLSDPSVQLLPAQLARLTYPQLLHYLDTRDKGHVESLRNEAAFVDKVMSFGAEQMANLVVRVILRVPGGVVDRGGARAEAIRILTSQLRAKYIAKKLLTGEVLVVIVPKNQLMTDLPEFASSRGTYTFDGRPWDTTRGLGGKNTAIAEENLLGVLPSTDPSMTRQGWKNQAEYEDDKSKGSEVKKTKDYNPDVYCSGYSTTNHEFFHTIHMFGLSKSDNSTINSLYQQKKGLPAATHWADGPRLDKSNNEMDNYSSSTVYEYFAQTGCAYQGTNTGTDSYTGRPRNNGRKWVEQNEPGLANILSRTVAKDELKGVNNRKGVEAKRKMERGGVAKGAEKQMLGSNGLTNNSRLMANRARLEKKLAGQAPPGLLVENK